MGGLFSTVFHHAIGITTAHPNHSASAQRGSATLDFTYLLRLWRANIEGGPVWRASVESPHSGERHGFANLGLLFAFLEEKTGELA